MSETLIGLDSVQVLCEVFARNPGIGSFEFVVCERSPSLQERLVPTPSESEAISLAMARRAQGVPFWDALIWAVSTGVADSKKILDLAMQHIGPVGAPRFIRGDVVGQNAWLEEEEEALRPGQMLAVLSRVTVESRVMHMPMIDLHLENTGRAHEVALAAVSALGLRGALIASGKSFHFIGFDLWNENELMKNLGKVLLLAPIVDRAWVAHQLLEGRCALRVSASDFYGFRPRVIAIVS